MEEGGRSLCNFRDIRDTKALALFYRRTQIEKHD